MYYLHWKDNFGRECKNERPETWENIEPILNAISQSGHYQKGSFRIEPIDNNEECYLTASIEFNGEKFLSLKDAAKVMGVSKYVAAKIINFGEIKDYGNPKNTMLKIKDVKNYIKKLKNGKIDIKKVKP